MDCGGEYLACRANIRMLLLATFPFLLLHANCTYAHPKTDNIRLTNGNEITGEIKHLIRGKLAYSTDSMGTVQIEWDDVAEVASSYQYEIRLDSGRRYYGSLAAADSGEGVRILQSDGEQMVRAIEIIELRPIEDSLSDRLDIRLGAGYSYNKSTEVATFNLTSEFGYEDEKGITNLKGRTLLTDNDGDSSDSNRYKISREMWTSRPQVIRWFDASYEDNEELALDYRYTVGLGYGRAFLDTNQISFVGYLGLQAATEREESGEKLDSVEAVLGATYDLWRFDTPEVDMELELTLYPGITESDRLRGNTDIRWSWELVEDLFWDITGWASYDNAIQSGSDTDYGVTTGVSWEY
jgi:hypothetical protein